MLTYIELCWVMCSYVHNSKQNNNYHSLSLIWR